MIRIPARGSPRLPRQPPAAAGRRARPGRAGRARAPRPRGDREPPEPSGRRRRATASTRSPCDAHRSSTARTSSRSRLVQRLVASRTPDQGRALEHLFGRALRVNGDASVFALVDGGHEAELRVEAVELPALVLAPRDVDVDPERPGSLEQADLGRLAPRLSRPLRIELGGAAGGDRPPEECEHRVRRERRRDVNAPLEVELAERRPDPDRSHAVLGQRAGLVRADDGGRSERLDRREALDERAAPRQRRDARRPARA